ncbi:MAG: hypothetical protein AB1801_18520 [Chloroflexota bacterium]
MPAGGDPARLGEQQGFLVYCFVIMPDDVERIGVYFGIAARVL